MRARVGSVLVSVAVVASMVLGGCVRRPLDHEAPEAELGEIALAIQVAPGVEYVGDLRYTISRRGDPVTEGSAPIREGVVIQVAGLVAGTGYAILLEAETSDHEIRCEGRAEFAVRAGLETILNVSMACSPGRRGGPVVVRPDFTPCDRLTAVTATPTASNPRVFDVAAVAHGGRGTGAFFWTSNEGAFRDQRSDRTLFTCTSTNPSVGISVHLTDPPCFDSVTVQVDCSGGPPADGGAPDACLQCEQTSCRNFQGLDVYASCHERTDRARSGGAAGQLLSVLCQEALACVRRTNCLDANGSAQRCYCGSVDDLGCLSGRADGPCKSEFERAAETVHPETIAERFVDPIYAVGGASLLLYCDAQACTQACLTPAP